MPQDVSDVLRRELSADETLLWSGQPRQGVLLKPSDAFLIPFSLLWAGFAVFWEVTVLASRAPFFFRLWGVPFVLVGLYIVFGRFLADARQRADTFYGVTSERIMIVTRWPSVNVKSPSLRSLSEMSFQERAGGQGTITFGPASLLPGWGGGNPWGMTGTRSAPSFEMIADARAVYEIIRSVQKA